MSLIHFENKETSTQNKESEKADLTLVLCETFSAKFITGSKIVINSTALLSMALYLKPPN